MARPVRSIQALISTVLLFSSPIALAVGKSSLRAYLDNASGVLRLKRKEYYPAYKDFLKTLNNDPLNSDIQMNLGLSLELMEEYDKAEQAYQSALEMAGNDRTRQFAALFNLGEVRTKKQDIDGALKAYQAALDIEPESLEVKTNIELLWQNQQGKGNSQQKNNGKGNDKDQNKDQNQGDNKKDQQNKDQNKDQKNDQNKQYEQPKPQPRQFQSKDLSKDDVRKILDEIESQEKSIRAKEYDKGAKEHRNDKDW